MRLKAPFPWFGGKSRVDAMVWQRFGRVRNYVEPFAGSLAVLLGRPTIEGTETVNDLDGLLSNFWRAVRLDPERTAEHADWPVSELAGTYTSWLEVLDWVTADFSAGDKRKLFRENAIRAYRL